MNNTIEIVKKILAEKIENVDALKEEDKLTDLGIDSLDLVEIMLQIEEELGIEFTNDELTSLTTLKSVVDLINSKINK